MTREERARDALFAADRAWAIGGEGLPLYQLRVEAMLAFADAEAAAMRERAAEAVEALRRETPYELNDHPCSVTKKRAAAAIRALPATGEVGR